MVERPRPGDVGPRPRTAGRPDDGDGARFPAQLLYEASSLYYRDDATQAEIAQRLGVSRPTVSRLLAEARRQGIVRIQVVAPDELVDHDLADRLAEALHLEGVHLTPGSIDLEASPSGGRDLAAALSPVLKAIGLRAGDIMLVSSGRTVYETSKGELPSFPGVLVAPTIGGHDDPDGWYQTNEIIRRFAAAIGGRPTFLFAPAIPGPDLYASLSQDPAIRRVLDMWDNATCAVLGIAAPPLTRTSIPDFVPLSTPSLAAAVGDVCSRFYDTDGRPVAFPGVERLMATPLESLTRIPTSIGIGVGPSKVRSMIAGATGGYFNHLVTDTATAWAVLQATQGE